MSTLSVTTVKSANSTTSLTLATGNTLAGSIVVDSSGGVVIKNNLISNALSVTSSGLVSISSSLNSNNILSQNVVSVNISSNTITSNIISSTNISSNSITSNNITVNSVVITSTNRIGINNTAPATSIQIGGNYGVLRTNLSVGNNHNVNCALGNYFVITCNSSAQNVYFTSTPANTVYSMTLRFANGSGGNTISWANTPRWPGATAPTPSTNNDIWVFITDDGGTIWRGNLVQKDSR
jgi:hypothetical protein